MSNITGGTVSIGDGVKSPIEYAPSRTVRVDLSFTVAEGSDPQAVLDSTALLANNTVRRLLRSSADDDLRTPPWPGVRSGETEAVDAAIETAVAKSASRKRANRTATATTAVDADPVDLADPTTASRPTSPDLSGSPGVALDGIDATLDALDKLEEESFTLAAPEPITDAALGSAVAQKNGQINSPERIKAVIAMFRTGNGAFHLSMIPAERRQEFLDKLAELK